MKKLISLFCLSVCLCTTMNVSAQGNAGIGQTIQINTSLSSYVGNPSWLLVIRDVDHGINIPYVFNFTQNDNFWIAMTYGRNYLIKASTLQFSPYRRYPDYNTRRIHNFCNLESRGRIIRGESMYITISGNLSPYTERFNCGVNSFPDNRFSVAH